MRSPSDSGAPRFAIQPAWRLVLKDLGIREADVLGRACLPLDLFAQDDVRLVPGDYFRLWRALDEVAADPCLPLRVGEALRVEGLDPPLFAALLSSDLETAITRLARFKPLVGPLAPALERTREGLEVTLACRGIEEPLPPLLATFEIVLLVTLTRLGTRERVRARAVTSPYGVSPNEAYTEFFGVPVQRGPRLGVTFATDDLRRPFLTVNEAMWQLFRPELELRLSDLEAEMTERVRRVLLELVPAGRTGIEDVARVLAVTPRTLQRRLRAEGTQFSRVLSHTREKLALHYLRSSTLSGAEIASLLGYEDPNSFIRAFSHWTGRTPERVRAELATDPDPMRARA